MTDDENDLALHLDVLRICKDRLHGGIGGLQADLASFKVEALQRGLFTVFQPDCDQIAVIGLLALLHHDITRPWNVDDLGREVGLSRSALAERFTGLIGMPPMHYLAHWRMQVASQKLRNTSASLAQVAESVGYDSEAAFSRAFKKAFSVAPATWRRSNG